MRASANTPVVAPDSGSRLDSQKAAHTAGRVIVRMKRIAWIAFALAAAGCDDAVVSRPTPAGPTPAATPTAPAPTAVSPVVRVVSGADQTPVRGATVVIGGKTYQSGDDGSVPVELSLDERDLDVTAAGFLPRRTTTGNQIVTLWPVANDAEADAVRRMVYRARRDAGRRAASSRHGARSS